MSKDELLCVKIKKETLNKLDKDTLLLEVIDYITINKLTLKKAKELLHKYIENNNLSLGYEREQVLEIIFSLKGNITAKTILSNTPNNTSIALKTIYNALSVLKRAGIIRRKLVEGGQMIYEIL